MGGGKTAQKGFEIMKKQAMFKELYEMREYLDTCNRAYGTGHNNSQIARAQWAGAMFMIEAAGLEEEYIDYRYWM